MTLRLQTAALVCALGAGALLAGTADAHEAGDWLLKGGVTYIAPKFSNGTLAGGTVKLDVGGSTRPSFSFIYMATRHVGVELSV